MKNKITYGVLAIVFIVAIVLTFTIGINVDLVYGEGYTIIFAEENKIDIDEVKTITKEIWGNNCLVQKAEFFNDSAEIKVKDFNDEQLSQLCNKLNEKYSSEIKKEDLRVEHVSNVKLRTLVEPYIIPSVLSLLLIMIFYAVRYRGARQMLSLLVNVIVAGGLYYSLYVIARLPFGTLTIPVGIAMYALIVLKHTMACENNQEED